jgi:hypothetical protein
MSERDNHESYQAAILGFAILMYGPLLSSLDTVRMMMGDYSRFMQDIVGSHNFIKYDKFHIHLPVLIIAADS